MTDTHPDYDPGPEPTPVSVSSFLPATGDRRPVETMTTDEKLDELLLIQREVLDALAAFEELPVFKALAEGKNPILAMMGR